LPLFPYTTLFRSQDAEPVEVPPLATAEQTLEIRAVPRGVLHPLDRAITGQVDREVCGNRRPVDAPGVLVGEQRHLADLATDPAEMLPDLHRPGRGEERRGRDHAIRPQRNQHLRLGQSAGSRRIRDPHQYRNPAVDFVDGHLEDSPSLFVREEPELPGRPEHEDAVNTIGDQSIQMAPERSDIDGGAVPAQGCAYRDHDSGQGCSHRTLSSFSPLALSTGGPMSSSCGHLRARRPTGLSTAGHCARRPSGMTPAQPTRMSWDVL